jgi:hypothetical protein
VGGAGDAKERVAGFVDEVIDLVVEFPDVGGAGGGDGEPEDCGAQRRDWGAGDGEDTGRGNECGNQIEAHQIQRQQAGCGAELTVGCSVASTRELFFFAVRGI